MDIDINDYLHDLLAYPSTAFDASEEEEEEEPEELALDVLWED